ncbi:MAG: hypothetical protein PHY32_03080 [Candidatus Pacebacteria bacterium]|nr:hypothetical protein [Candidatus Paceibacterota bacterium]
MNDKKLQIPALILGLSLVLSVIILGNFIYKIQSLNNTLTVTGSARQKVTSDTGKLVGRFMRNTTINNLKDGYKLMESDKTKIVNFFKAQGIDEKAMTISTVSQQEI